MDGLLCWVRGGRISARVRGRCSPPPATPRFSVFSLSPMFCGVRCVLERGQVAFMASKRWNSWGLERPPPGPDAWRLSGAGSGGCRRAGWSVWRAGCFSSSMRYYCTKVKYPIGFCGTRRRPKRINAIADHAASDRRMAREVGGVGRSLGWKGRSWSTSSEWCARTLRASGHAGVVETRRASPRKGPILSHHATPVLCRTVTHKSQYATERYGFHDSLILVQ